MPAKWPRIPGVDTNRSVVLRSTNAYYNWQSGVLSARGSGPRKGRPYGFALKAIQGRFEVRRRYRGAWVLGLVGAVTGLMPRLERRSWLPWKNTPQRQGRIRRIPPYVGGRPGGHHRPARGRGPQAPHRDLDRGAGPGGKTDVNALRLADVRYQSPLARPHPLSRRDHRNWHRIGTRAG